MKVLRKFIHGFLTLLGALAFLFGGIIMGPFASAGICGFIWGNAYLDAASGNSNSEYLHPSFWLFIILLIPFMLIGFGGGLLACFLIQAYADWKFGDIDRAEAFAKIKHWLKGP